MPLLSTSMIQGVLFGGAVGGAIGAVSHMLHEGRPEDAAFDLGVGDLQVLRAERIRDTLAAYPELEPMVTTLLELRPLRVRSDGRSRQCWEALIKLSDELLGLYLLLVTPHVEVESKCPAAICLKMNRCSSDMQHQLGLLLATAQRHGGAAGLDGYAEERAMLAGLCEDLIHNAMLDHDAPSNYYSSK